jgi:hypothetical protein
MLRWFYRLCKALIKAGFTLIVPAGLSLHTDWFSVLGSLVSKVFLLALKAFFQIYFVKISIVSKENTFRDQLVFKLLWYFVVNDVEEFFVPLSFFVVVNNGLKLMCVNPAWKSFSRNWTLFIIGLVPFSSIALSFSQASSSFLLWFCFQEHSQQFCITHFV